MSTNLINNPDFESGNLGWGIDGTTAGILGFDHFEIISMAEGWQDTPGHSLYVSSTIQGFVGQTVEIPESRVMTLAMNKRVVSSSGSGGVGIRLLWKATSTGGSIDTEDHWMTSSDAVSSTIYHHLAVVTPPDGANYVTVRIFVNNGSGSVEAYIDDINLLAESPLLPVFNPNSNYRHTYLSGIEINQNQVPTGNLTPVAWHYQTFHLPDNFERGNTASPDLTGVQICTQVSGSEDFFLNIKIEKNIFGSWATLDSGSVTQTHADGQFIWVTAYFNSPILIQDDDLDRQFRVGVQSGYPVWYSVPGLFPNESKTFSNGQLTFRLLSNSGDSGEDFLGNSYRSVVMRNGLGVVTTQASPNPNTFWLSKPNPSKFAVESLYFDISDIDQPNVVDRILLDPITPGIYFNVYYSSEGDPATNESDWEYKLWSPVKQIFKAERRQEFVLSEPITARYIKIEFTHLQPQFYQPGTFHQPITYKKFPRWVQEHFTTNPTPTDEVNISKNVRVIFDSLRLAFNPKVDDLTVSPQIPFSQVSTSRTNNVVEQSTMDKISTTLQPFSQQPSARVKSTASLLGTYAAANKDSTYPAERIRRAKADVSQVSSLNRSSLITESQATPMFFYMTCRHAYKELMANFENDRAYFVGVREIALSRDHYTVATDTEVYIENLSDFTNVMRNDFI